MATYSPSAFLMSEFVAPKFPFSNVSPRPSENGHLMVKLGDHCLHYHDFSWAIGLMDPHPSPSQPTFSVLTQSTRTCQNVMMIEFAAPELIPFARTASNL
ncbi:hypothetical protein D5086_008613 [Populus alba]|uniref:Uncharacterized protein n=1 Tax=Populus alba TaxID=43335 RepID=A0ACC4CHJ0_POPAL